MDGVAVPDVHRPGWFAFPGMSFRGKSPPKVGELTRITMVNVTNHLRTTSSSSWDAHPALSMMVSFDWAWRSGLSMGGKDVTLMIDGSWLIAVDNGQHSIGTGNV